MSCSELAEMSLREPSMHSAAASWSPMPGMHFSALAAAADDVEVSSICKCRWSSADGVMSEAACPIVA